MLIRFNVIFYLIIGKSIHNMYDNEPEVNSFFYIFHIFLEHGYVKSTSCPSYHCPFREKISYFSNRIISNMHDTKHEGWVFFVFFLTSHFSYFRILTRHFMHTIKGLKQYWSEPSVPPYALINDRIHWIEARISQNTQQNATTMASLKFLFFFPFLFSVFSNHEHVTEHTHRITHIARMGSDRRHVGLSLLCSPTL